MANIIDKLKSIEIAEVGGVATDQQDFMSLDDRMLKAYAQRAVGLGGDRKEVVRGVERAPGKLSDPVHLFEMQQRISDYSLQVALTSALTRKAVGAVETVLRA